MIRWNVKAIAEPQRWTARKLSIATGIAYNSIWLIWAGKAKRVDLTTLDKLCTVLDVHPSDILIRE